MLSLLDTIDPVFGWTGISCRFPNSWKLTAHEVAEYLDDTFAKVGHSAAIIKHYRRQQRKLKCRLKRS
jgi:hypothetical protein